MRLRWALRVHSHLILTLSQKTVPSSLFREKISNFLEAPPAALIQKSVLPVSPINFLLSTVYDVSQSHLQSWHLYPQSQWTQTGRNVWGVVSQWCQFVPVSLMSQPQKHETDSGGNREMGHDCNLFLSSLSMDPQISDRTSLLTHVQLFLCESTQAWGICKEGRWPFTWNWKASDWFERNESKKISPCPIFICIPLIFGNKAPLKTFTTFMYS